MYASRQQAKSRPDGPDGPLAVAAEQNGFQPSVPPAWTRALPFVYVAFVLLLETAQQEEWAVSFFLIALPAIAAYAYGPGVVLGLTVFAIALEGSLAAVSHHLGETHHVTADIATAVVGVLAAVLAAHRRRQERHLVHASSVAEALMRALLRPVPHRVGHVLAAGLYRPGEAGTITRSSTGFVSGSPAGRLRARRRSSTSSTPTSPATPVACTTTSRCWRSPRTASSEAAPAALHFPLVPAPAEVPHEPGGDVEPLRSGLQLPKMAQVRGQFFLGVRIRAQGHAHALAVGEDEE
ncbi:hypothetical protein ACFXA3_03175 [Streptomyces sp. NPDC059456]|uniref:hypothetical protein n=1 Tax=Streptomyces sp. NPDC059456 TaxID=3346838 RepID=UPI003691B644